MPEASAIRILVVDDVLENRELARMALEEEGYLVTCAASGDEALARFVAERPALVLLDIRMPRMDGFEICERLRALEGGKAASIIFLTALRDVDNFDRAVAAGGDDFLTKPVRPTELVVRVKALLDLKRLDDALNAQVDLIRQQRDHLVRLQLHQERLTSFLVHDLKNPVNSIDLHAQLLARRKDLPEDALASVASIRKNTKHLLHLILTLLDLGKGEEGRLEPRRAAIDLAALTAEITEAVAERARAAEIEVARMVDVPAGDLVADVALVRRVVENLLDNAFRHTPRGGRIELRATRSADAIEIVVADSGPGVPAALRDSIFDRYVQADAGVDAYRANRGLGLAFCRVAMEAHGGSIALDPAAAGASFRLRFPRA